MTERLYYTSDNTEGRANVLSCTPEPDGRYAVVLDSTLFHPQGGGQPADAGWIDNQPVETVQSRGDEVLHIVAKPLSVGAVNLRVDAALRQLHARLHSAGHLIGLAGTEYGWHPVKAHHWPNEGRITFAAGCAVAAGENQRLAGGKPCPTGDLRRWIAAGWVWSSPGLPVRRNTRCSSFGHWAGDDYPGEVEKGADDRQLYARGVKRTRRNYLRGFSGHRSVFPLFFHCLSPS